MCYTNSKDHSFPEGVNVASPCELRSMLFHVENLQHQRVYFYLVAETIFFLAASTVADCWLPLLGLIIGGAATAIAFTIINLKHQWRVLWLVKKLAHVSPEYRRYVNFSHFEKLVGAGLNSFEETVSKCIIYPINESEEPTTHADIPCRHDAPHWFTVTASTGFWFTWGLFLIFMLTWIFFFVH